MDAGGLAQMTFNNYNGTASFGSRGKATHLRNITVPANGGLSAPQDVQQVPTPRTARAALLTGLRTAPKSPMPQQQQQQQNHHTASHHYGMEQQQHGGYGNQYNDYGQQTRNQQRLPTPPTMASPAIHVSDEDNDYDQDAYAQLMAQQMYLAQLQQQLAAAHKVQQLQQQLAQLQMQGNAGYAATPPMSPGMGMNGANMYNTNQMYNPYQQQQQFIQQNVNASYYQQQLAQQLQFQQQHQQYQMPAQVEISPPTPQAEDPPVNVMMAPPNRQQNRSRSPPKSTSPPQQVQQQRQEQQQQSGNGIAFRRGHRKASSLSTCVNVNNLEVEQPPRTALPKLANIPMTPMTATFAPGHASGLHPVRQPRGPPSIEELRAKPTAKDEGSQNFAMRQRRRAISKLVSAGIERRAARTAGSVAGTMTPVSEHEAFAFEETSSVGSGASGRLSRQSLREIELNISGSDHEGSGNANGRLGAANSRNSGLRTPSLVLSAAEKRKSALF